MKKEFIDALYNPVRLLETIAAYRKADLKVLSFDETLKILNPIFSNNLLVIGNYETWLFRVRKIEKMIFILRKKRLVSAS